jgi:predicted nucleotidyltransferase
MRITDREKAAIVAAIHAKDPLAKIYLFGSRARDELKGGDIDLLVLSTDIVFSDKIDILLAMKATIGEQKIDLKIVSPLQLANDAFAQSILPSALRLDGAQD